MSLEPYLKWEVTPSGHDEGAVKATGFRCAYIVRFNTSEHHPNTATVTVQFGPSPFYCAHPFFDEAQAKDWCERHYARTLEAIKEEA